MKSLLRPALLLFVLVSLFLLAGCGSNQPPADTVQPHLQEMLASKYAAYKSANNLPENAGVLVYLQSPKGSWLATAGLPVGADENWHTVSPASARPLPRRPSCCLTSRRSSRLTMS